MRLRALTLIAVLFMFIVGAVPASATSQGHGYLALGDSVPFGFSPLVSPLEASNFVGYPEAAAKMLNIEEVNASCPGEASGGFLSLTGTDNVCRPYRSAFPLHVSYTTSQIDFATTYLRMHRDTRLVSLTLGANDAFRFETDCAANPPGPTCALGLGGVLANLQANLRTIFADIRATGYTGLIVAVTYYALNYSDPASVAGSQALNAEMDAAAAPYGVLIADGFAAWKPTALAAGGDSCAAGLLILLPDGTCNIHPSPAGRDLLAKALVDTIAASCPAASATGCLMRHQAA